MIGSPLYASQSGGITKNPRVSVSLSRSGTVWEWLIKGFGQKVKGKNPWNMFLGAGNSNIFFMFTPIWGRFPFWLIFFKGVETTNQMFVFSRVFRQFMLGLTIYDLDPGEICPLVRPSMSWKKLMLHIRRSIAFGISSLCPQAAWLWRRGKSFSICFSLIYASKIRRLLV